MKLKREDLSEIASRMKAVTTLRDETGRVKITVHMGECGIKAGARDIMKAIIKQIEAGDTSDVIVVTSGCAGMCDQEPMITVEIEGESPVRYGKLDSGKVEKIFSDHLKNGVVVREYALSD